jgi:hypothetical protein
MSIWAAVLKFFNSIITNIYFKRIYIYTYNNLYSVTKLRNTDDENKIQKIKFQKAYGLVIMCHNWRSSVNKQPVSQRILLTLQTTVVIICPFHLKNILYLWVLYVFRCKQRVSLNSTNKLIFVMVKCDLLFEVRTEFLNIILLL